MARRASRAGWRRLLEEPDWCHGHNGFALPAYSEYLPPPYVGVKPYGTPAEVPGVQADEHGWNITEYEEEQELWPGLEMIARHVLEEMVRLGEGQHLRFIARRAFRGNPYWPEALARRAGQLPHEHYVLLL